MEEGKTKCGKNPHFLFYFHMKASLYEMDQDMFAIEENSEDESLENSGNQFRHDPNIIGKISIQIWSM